MRTIATSNGFPSFLIPEKPTTFDDLSSSPSFLTTGQTTPEWQAWTDLIDDLLALRSLDDDWDGQGAEAPAQELVDSSIRLACILRSNRAIPAHYATAGVGGTIHLEWVYPDRSVDIEIIEPGLAEVCPVNLLESPSPVGHYRW